MSCDSDAPQVGSARSDWTRVVKVNRRKTNRRKTNRRKTSPYCVCSKNQQNAHFLYLYFNVTIVSLSCSEHPIFHPQEDLYMQLYAISFMHPYKQCGRLQDELAMCGTFQTSKFHFLFPSFKRPPPRPPVSGPTAPGFYFLQGLIA